MKTCYAVGLALALMPHSASATSYYRPSFGAPVVVSDKLVFGDDVVDAHRLICINRKSGAKQWEVSDPRRTMKPWFDQGGDVIVTAGGVLQKCDGGSGKMTPLYTTGFTKCESVSAYDTQVLIVGYRS